MNIGLFGGSFDPIHCGHLTPVLDAMTELGLDRVVYLPTGRPPHKPDRKLAPALARYAMTEIALLGHDRLWVSGRELDETAPSYTIDTLLHFRAEHPHDELHLLIGSDSYVELRSWHRVDEIVAIARLAVLTRPGVALPDDVGAGADDLPSPRPGADAASCSGGAERSPVLAPRVRFVRNRPLDVSSTAVRRCLARGERPPAGWVPDPVVDFALKYRLYR
jgi:nicotinate-nucleotide adenylyltransferase